MGIFFKQVHLPALLGKQGGDSRACRTAADDQDIAAYRRRPGGDGFCVGQEVYPYLEDRSAPEYTQDSESKLDCQELPIAVERATRCHSLMFVLGSSRFCLMIVRSNNK